MAGNINFINADASSFKDKAKPIIRTAKFLRGVNAKKSISALSKDLIMQFPVLMSADVSMDVAVNLAKALEAQYAAMYLAVWTADSLFGVENAPGGVRDFIKRYHNNDDIPDMITYGGNLLTIADRLGLSSMESVVECTIKYHPAVSADEMDRLWSNPEDRLALESINDFYLPIKSSNKKINSITKALEAKIEFDEDEVLNTLNKLEDSSIAPESKYNGNVNQGITKTSVFSNATGFGPNQKMPFVKPSDKLTGLEPTLIDVTFLAKSSEPLPGVRQFETDKNGKTTGKDVTMRMQRAIVGVKTMIRLISSEYMVPNVISAINDQSLAFKFVKWTKGEMKIGRDMLLGISRIKEDAKAKNQADAWFAALRKRKRNAKTFRFSETGINPFTTLVITSNEVEIIKDNSGYDLTNISIVKQLMDNLYLLGFVIVNEQTGMVQTIFDGYNSFSTTTINSLKSSTKSDTSIDTLRELKQIMGRM